MSVDPTFQEALELLIADIDIEEKVTVRQALFGDFETLDHCLSILSSPKDQIDHNIALLCSNILIDFVSQETDDSEFSEFSRLVKFVFTILANPVSAGRDYSQNLCRFLLIIYETSDFSQDPFLELASELVEGSESDKLVGFCILNFIANTCRMEGDPGSSDDFFGIWMKAIEDTLTPDLIMGGECTELVGQILAEFSNNAKYWSEIYFTEGLVGFKAIAQLFNIFSEISEEGSIIEDDAVRISCLHVIQAFHDLLTEPTCDIIIEFKSSEGYHQIYTRIIRVIPDVVSIFRTDQHCQIPYLLIEIVRFDFLLMLESDFSLDRELISSMMDAISAAAQLTPASIADFTENPDAFYIDAYLDNSENARSSACQLLRLLCEAGPIDIIIELIDSIPVTEGKLRLLSVLFSFAKELDDRDRLSDDLKSELVALAESTTVSEKMEIAADIVNITTLLLMSEQLFLRPQAEVEAAYSIAVSEGGFLQKESESFSSVRFTVGCRMLKAVMALGKTLPDDVLSDILDKSSSCLSEDVIVIIEKSVTDQDNYQNSRGTILKFVLSEILRIENSRNEDYSRIEENCLDKCYECVKHLYQAGVDDFIEFWHEFYSIPCCDPMGLLKCVIEMCQLQIPEMSKVMEPVWLRLVDLQGIDDSPEIEDIMRIFMYFFHFNSDYVSANMEEHEPLIDSLWKLFSSWKSTQDNEPVTYLLNEIIVFFIQEKWLSCDLAGFATKLAVDTLISTDPLEFPALCLAALDTMISVLVFYREECPNYDPVALYPDLLVTWNTLFDSGSIVRAQDVVMHSLLFTHLTRIHPSDEHIYSALAFLQGWSEFEVESNPNLHEIVDEFEGVFSSAFASLVQINCV